jgi:hypothetical protein
MSLLAALDGAELVLLDDDSQRIVANGRLPRREARVCSLPPFPRRQPRPSDASRFAMENTFSILSTQAPLIEIIDDESLTDRAGGLVVPDGTVSTAPSELLTRPVRYWRVDAPSEIRTSVVVTDSPYGAFVAVRRPVETAEAEHDESRSDDARWSELHAVMRHYAPTVATLWQQLTGRTEPSASWRDVSGTCSNHAQAHGGDIIVVSFVRGRCGHA